MLTLPELIVEIVLAGGSLAVVDGELTATPEMSGRVSLAIEYHRNVLTRYVTAFPGGRWPSSARKENSLARTERIAFDRTVT